MIITQIRGLRTPLKRTLIPKPYRALKGTILVLITCHEPPSRVNVARVELRASCLSGRYSRQAWGEGLGFS